MNGHEGHAGRHGMAVVGKQAIFFSHMPTFDAPHDWQLLMEVKLGKEGENPHQVYLEDRKRRPKEMLYSFDPVEFVIEDLLPHDGGHEGGHGGGHDAPDAGPASITGALARGHWEKTSSRLIKDVVAEVVTVVHARQFDPAAPPPESLEYVLFGKGKELFLAHRITQPPDFDHLLAVTVQGHKFKDEDLARGVTVAIPGRENTIDDRLKLRATVPAAAAIEGKELKFTVRPTAEHFLDFEFLG